MQFCRTHCTSSTDVGHPFVLCSAGGTVVPRSCTSGCEAHGTSQRCRLHRGPVCSSSGCGEVPSPGVVGMCETHCNHPQCSLPALPPPPASTSRRHPNRSLLICRHRSYTERAHPECSTRHCTMHCSSSRCQFHHATPNGLGAGNPMSDGPAIPPVIPSRHFQRPTFVAARSVST